MATIGLRDLYCAEITTDAQGKDTYGTPEKLAAAISAEMSVDVAEAFLYADDAVADVAREFVKGTLKLGVDDLTPENAAMLLGQTLGTDNVIYAGGDDLPPYFAIGFRARRNDGTFKYVWLYKVKFSVPNEKYQTKADKIEFVTPEIEGTFIKRADGLWKADFVAEENNAVATAWFNAVHEKPAG